MKRYVKNVMKLLVILIIGGMIGYIVFFYPISVKSVKVSEDTIIAQALGTGTLEARVYARI